MMTVNHLNKLSKVHFIAEVRKCCHSSVWASELEKTRPFSNLNDLLEKSNSVFLNLKKEDFLEAFTAHSKIGNLDSLKDKHQNTKQWSKQEQSSASRANNNTLKTLLSLNEEYFQKHNFIFIVFATGKSADEMLQILKKRIYNSTEEELKNASLEQIKITTLRLEKLANEFNHNPHS